MAISALELRIRATNKLNKCGNCAALTRGMVRVDGSPGLFCGICHAPLRRGKPVPYTNADRVRARVEKLVDSREQPKPKVQTTLEEAERRDFAQYKNELRRKERQQETGEDIAEKDTHEFWRSDPGYPLGPGYPPGRPQRADGQSHREGWASIVRADPCSYCGRDGGTVDHIEPTSKGGRNIWLNYTGACNGCNVSKSDTPLLAWLFRRGVLATG